MINQLNTARRQAIYHFWLLAGACIYRYSRHTGASFGLEYWPYRSNFGGYGNPDVDSISGGSAGFIFDVLPSAVTWALSKQGNSLNTIMRMLKVWKTRSRHERRDHFCLAAGLKC